MTIETGPNGAGPRGGLNGAEAIELSAQLAGLARAGLPLGASLAALADELPRGRLRRSMHELSRELDTGLAPGDALASEGGRIPAHLKGLVSAGVRTGRLGEVMGEFSQYAAIGVELRRRLKLNLAYPILSLLITLTLFSFVCVAVLPQFAAMFRDFGVPLPKLSLWIISFAGQSSPLWPMLGTIVFVVVALPLAVRVFAGPAAARGLASHIPLLGGVWRWSSLSEFCHLLGMLLDYGLPMPEALRFAGDGVQDANIDRAARRVAESVQHGHGLARAMARRGGFPPRLPRLLRWAENNGSLPDVLHMAGEMFAARASAHATFTAAVVSVLCFLAIVMGLFLFFLGVMLPTVNLISRLSG